MPIDIRPIRVEGNLAFVTLTRGCETFLDADDAHLVSDFNWQVQPAITSMYATRAVRTARGMRKVAMHRLIMDAPDGLEVDHIDGNGLNNRRCNLRLATTAQNQHNQAIGARNTSGFKGVTWHKGKKKWYARIKNEEKRHCIGLFDTALEAHEACVAARIRLHGQFARNE